MAEHTIHAVQSFTVNEWGEYAPDVLVRARSPSDALRIAARAYDAGKPSLAFSRTGNENVGAYDEPQIIARIGEIPEHLVEVFREAGNAS